MKNSTTVRSSVKKRNLLDKNKLRKEEKKKKSENKRANSYLAITNLNQEMISRNLFSRTLIVHMFGFSSLLMLSKKKESLMLGKSLKELLELLTSLTNKRNSIYTLHTWIWNITLEMKRHSLRYLREQKQPASLRMYISSYLKFTEERNLKWICCSNYLRAWSLSLNTPINVGWNISRMSLPSENKWLSKNKSLSWIRVTTLRKFSREHWFVLKRTNTLFYCLNMPDYSTCIIKSKQAEQLSRHFLLTIPRELTYGVSIWIWKWNMEQLIPLEIYSIESLPCNSSPDKWSSSSGNSFNSKLLEDHLKVSKLLNRRQLNSLNR